MKFSIVVPVYNVERFLQTCLDSLVNQTYKDMEIIVVDDGSTDRSGKICDLYAAKYHCVSVIHQENTGLSGARNRGMARAHGEWIVFVDSDDWVETDMLERLMCCILATDADWYHFLFQRTNEEGENANVPTRAQRHQCIFLDINEEERFKFYEEKLLPFQIGWSAWGAIYRKDIIDRNGLAFADTDAVYAEDLLFSFQYLLYVRKAVLLGDQLYHYRLRAGSLVNATEPAQVLLRISALGERAFWSVRKAELPYFVHDFYRLYYRMMDFHILRYRGVLDGLQIHELLRKLWKHKFHRNCMKKIRRHYFLFQKHTGWKAWYRIGFGTEVYFRAHSFFTWLCEVPRQNAVCCLHSVFLYPYEYFLDEKHKTAYLNNSKAACSSIKVSMLRKSNMPDDYSVHKVAKDQMVSLQNALEGECFTFTFVRNPFARLVSCYESKYHNEYRFGENIYENYLGGYMGEDKGFAVFVNQICHIPHRMEEKHFKSQYDLVVGKDGEPVVDFVGKVEDLPEAFEPIRKKYGYDPLMIYNRTEYGNWKEYYTTRLVRKVYRKYKKDVKYFGYEQEYRELLEYCDGK